MMENKKHVFWQALFLTAFFFLIGLVLGVYLEQMREDNFNTSFYQSEVSLYDSLALSKLLEDDLASCNQIKNASIKFADKIYEESRDLERFDEKNKLTESLKTVHRKYDLLRTLLWMNVIEIKEKCSGVNSVIYLYIYDTQDINIKSEQAVWGRVLGDLKDQEGNEIILIPIATDSNLSSLDFLTEKYGVQRYPAVIINEEYVLYDMESASELRKYLD